MRKRGDLERAVEIYTASCIRQCTLYPNKNFWRTWSSTGMLVLGSQTLGLSQSVAGPRNLYFQKAAAATGWSTIFPSHLVKDHPDCCVHLTWELCTLQT